MHLPRLLLSAPASGSGKTLITCGILQAFVDRGLRTASFKCGPDYIDPMFHGRIIGTKSRNLDTFFTGEADTRYLFARSAAGMDISVIEGVMGYYDGLGGISVSGSTYDVAQVLKAPAVLIVNCKGASMSLLALIKGFLEYETDSRIRGVILNQMSPMIYEEMKEIIERELGIRVFGYVPKVEELILESRHLGLVLPEEVEALKEKLHRLAEVLEKSLDLDGLLALAGEAEDISFAEPEIPKLSGAKKPRIAVASDGAFCFTYEDNLQLLEDMGAELVYFSPLKDSALPGGAQGLLLSGGYPELYAKELSENTAMRTAIYQAIEQGMPCIAECGGFLYLHEQLEGADGGNYPMAGVIAGRAYRTGRLGRFGYITLRAREDQMLLQQGEEIRGHEFHYWDSENCGGSMHAAKPLRKRSWTCVHGRENLYAGFPHLFYYSNTEAAFRFLEKCEG